MEVVESKANIIFPFASFIDYPNPEAHSINVFFMGCGHNCENCSNPQFQDINYKEEGVESFNPKELYNALLQYSEKYRTNKIVFEGGDPFFSSNKDFVKEFLEINNCFEVCIYTGYEIDYVKSIGILNFTFLKCGVFDKSQYQEPDKTDEYIKFASKNQKLYNSNYELLSEDGVYTFKN